MNSLVPRSLPSNLFYIDAEGEDEGGLPNGPRNTTLQLSLPPVHLRNLHEHVAAVARMDVLLAPAGALHDRRERQERVRRQVADAAAHIPQAPGGGALDDLRRIPAVVMSGTGLPERILSY